jgi:hypothetical protein
VCRPGIDAGAVAVAARALVTVIVAHRNVVVSVIASPPVRDVPCRIDPRTHEALRPRTARRVSLPSCISLPLLSSSSSSSCAL